MLSECIIREAPQLESANNIINHPTQFCALKPSKKQSGAIGFYFRCSQARAYVTIILLLGYYIKESEASDGGGELEYWLTKFAAYHIHYFTSGINFGHASFLKERDEWPDFFAIFLVTADSHNVYQSFSKRNTIRTICHQFDVKDPTGDDPTKLY